MKTDHISSEMMSDLLDNDLALSEREASERHIHDCPECRREFQRLKGTLEFCTGLATMDFSYPDINRAVMRKFRIRRLSRQVLRVGPAAAASVIILFGFALYEGGYIGSHEEPIPIAETTSQNRYQGNGNAPVSVTTDDVEQVIGILRDNNATVLNVSDIYVEGKVPLSQFDQLRRNLGFRRVTYAVIDEAITQGKDLMPSNIEEVNSQDTTDGGQYIYRKTGEPYMHFKVFR